MTSKISSGSDLFLRGAGRYLDALTAIAAFREEVQDMCAETFEHHATELAAKMGLDAKDWEPYEENDPDVPWAEVGIRRPAQKDCTFGLFLSWGENKRADGVISVAVFLGFYRKSLRDEILAGFRKKNPRCRVEIYSTYTLALYQSLKDLALARDTLEAVLLEWLGYCKSIGGLKLNQQATP